MRLTCVIATTALFLPTVLADGDSIVTALDTVADATAALNDTVIDWNGGLLGTVPIIEKSTALLADANKLADTTQQSANLSDLEAFTIALSVVGLISDINTTLTTIVANKQRFAKLLLSPVILLNLQLEKSATDKFSSALETKLPAALVDAAKKLAQETDDIFDAAIKAYEWSLKN